MSTTKITGTGLGLPTADGAALGGTSNEFSDLYLADGSVIYFGADQEIKVTHVADTGLTLKHTATADDKPIVLTLQTGETDMAADDIIGAINFQAPDEGTGTDAVLVAAAIKAYAEGDFSSSSNATTLGFYTGASEAAAIKMTLSSAGALDVTGDITGSTLNADGDTAAGDNAAIGYTSAEGLILTGQGSTNDITIKNDADAVVAKVLTGTTNFELAANLVLASGQGIDFAATSDSNAGLSSELFDDYEEGIYNPTVTCASSGSYGLNASYDTLAYTKFGRLTHVIGRINVTSESSPSGLLQLSLPTTVANLAELANDGFFPMIISAHGDGGIESPCWYISGGATSAHLYNFTDAGAQESVDESRVDTAFELHISLTYISA